MWQSTTFNGTPSTIPDFVKLKPQVESLPIFEKPAMVDPCGLNVVDGPFLWCGTKPVILGSDYFDYSLAALAIGLQK